MVGLTAAGAANEEAYAAGDEVAQLRDGGGGGVGAEEQGLDTAAALRARRVRRQKRPVQETARMRSLPAGGAPELRK